MERPTELLRQLTAAGYQAYFVGGCVRDTLLGRPVHDWDIATSARPEQVAALFEKTVPTGIKHGTVTVLSGGGSYEVTTFRTDGEYRDGRHPEAVSFLPDLTGDLSRRDFTVNAMAMDEAGTITDLFGGREDLSRRLLRCVGQPEARFREDALRMLRAFRFSAQLGFSIEEKTLAAIAACAPLCAGLSAERVRDEVEKTLLSPSPETVEEMARLGLLRAVGMTETMALTGLSGLPATPVVRWAALFRACPTASWEALRLDKKTGQTAFFAARNSGVVRDRLAWKRLICREGEAAARCTATLDGQSASVEEILSSGECLSLKDLAVSGKDFPDLDGKAVGNRLADLLDHVLRHPEDNRREILLRRNRT